MSKLEPVLMGLYISGLGLTLALNLRGFVSRSLELTCRSMDESAVARVLRRVPPWKSAFAKPIEERVKRQARLARGVGVVLTVVGLHMVGVGFGLFG